MLVPRYDKKHQQKQFVKPNRTVLTAKMCRIFRATNYLQYLLTDSIENLDHLLLIFLEYLKLDWEPTKREWEQQFWSIIYFDYF